MKRFLAIVLTAIMAFGIVAPAGATQFSEDSTEGQWAFARIGDNGDFDILIVMELDIGDRSTANMMVVMLEGNPDIVGDLVHRPKVYRNHDIDECTFLTGKAEVVDTMEDVTLAMCADGKTVYMVMGTERKVVTEMAESILDGNDVEEPKGYIDMSSLLD